jgi:membrane associated rhomboid family serine protease
MDNAWAKSIMLTPDSFPDEPYRLFTSMFAHAGIIHLLLNMYALSILGSATEELVGTVKTYVIYLIGGLAGGLAYLASSPSLPAVGASGAIFALLGFLFTYSAFNLRILFFIVLNVLIGFIVPNIAWEAHLGGLAVGLAAGLYLSHQEKQNQENCVY